MTNANSLPYYPRFIFSCNDGKYFSTGDLDFFKFVKKRDRTYDITSFSSGDEVDIYWENDDGKTEVIAYTVDHIDIHQIKRDIDEPTKGLNMNDCTLFGKEKKWIMEIYIFLNKIK
ncbi:hypothetical protein V9L05_21840 (plasmid) [Bernardetia sp. Wsw4-3y2]|uniref:hypothetical protein n=1 Tax=Bernardetia sp. Wsw4-3y2 TaxID=3127471 RepID=UPI0030D13A52